MTGSFSNLLSLSVISLTAYAVADFLRSEPIYESLLERLLKNNGKYEFSEGSKDKILLEMPVCLDSEMDGKKIKELKLPSECLLVGIRRGEKEVIPKGNTTIHSGDCLIVLVNESKAAETNEQLSEMSRMPSL
jgi:Trk K+ transport system NAD-binding subunit